MYSPLLNEHFLHAASVVREQPACLCVSIAGHVAVGVGWLRHCHSLDVMRKSSIDLPLWSASLQDPRGLSVLWWELTAVNRGRPIPEGPRASRTGARLIDCSNKILTSLSETVTSQACVGRGGEREERDGTGEGEQSVCVCVCLFLKGQRCIGENHQAYVQFTVTPFRHLRRQGQTAVLPGSLDRNGRPVIHRSLILD